MPRGELARPISREGLDGDLEHAVVREEEGGINGGGGRGRGRRRRGGGRGSGAAEPVCPLDERDPSSSVSVSVSASSAVSSFSSRRGDDAQRLCQPAPLGVEGREGGGRRRAIAVLLFAAFAPTASLRATPPRPGADAAAARAAEAVEVKVVDCGACIFLYRF